MCGKAARDITHFTLTNETVWDMSRRFGLLFSEMTYNLSFFMMQLLDYVFHWNIFEHNNHNSHFYSWLMLKRCLFKFIKIFQYLVISKNWKIFREMLQKHWSRIFKRDFRSRWCKWKEKRKNQETFDGINGYNTCRYNIWFVSKTANNEKDLLKLLKTLSEAIQTYTKKTTLLRARQGKLKDVKRCKNVPDERDVQICSRGHRIHRTLL